MMKVKGIFAVSFIAMMVVGGAYANIASQGYVDQQIDTRQVAGDYATNAALSSVRTTATNAQSAAAAAQTAADEAADAADAAASAAATAQKTANAKVSTAQGSSAANKAVITNAAGNITTGTIASGMIANDAVTSAKLAAGAVDATALASNAVTSAKIEDGTIVNADIASNAAIAASKISGLSTVATTGSYDDLADKPTIPSAYVLKAATSSALGGVKSGGDITVATSGAVTVNSATKADSATKATQDASGNVITSTYAKKTELSAKQNASTAVEVATAGTAVGDSTHPVYVNASGVATKIDKVAAAAKADTATSATSAASATKATQDGNGANIANTYAKKTELPTVNNATLTIQKNGTNVATFTANSANAATANITVPTKTSELTNDSNYATTAQVNARVATAQGTDNANDVMVVNSSGNVTPALITNANISSSAAIAQSKISGLTDALAEKLSTTGTAAKATADAKGNNIADTYATKSQINALDSTSTGTGAVVTGVSQTDGKVSVTKGNVQIPVGSATATTYATIWVQ